MYFTVVLLGVVASRRLPPSVLHWLVRCRSLILDIGIHDAPRSRRFSSPVAAIVMRGSAPMIQRVRVPSWTAAVPSVVLNGAPLRNADGAPEAGGAAGLGGRWVVVTRHWHPGDWQT